MRMRASAERQQRGRIKSDGGKSKTRVKVRSFSKPFRWCFEYRTSLQKIFSMTKIGRFLRGFFTCRFFSSGFSRPFKDFQDSTPKVMFLYKSDFHWQSNAFLWFDFQTRGFTYQGGNASQQCSAALRLKAKINLPRQVYLLARCLMLN